MPGEQPASARRKEDLEEREALEPGPISSGLVPELISDGNCIWPSKAPIKVINVVTAVVESEEVLPVIEVLDPDLAAHQIPARGYLQVLSDNLQVANAVALHTEEVMREHTVGKPKLSNFTCSCGKGYEA